MVHLSCWHGRACCNCTTPETWCQLVLSGRVVSDTVCAGAKRPRPRRREADLLMDSFAEGLSDGRPRGRGQRRQPQGKALCAPAPSRQGHSALASQVLNFATTRLYAKSVLKMSTEGESQRKRDPSCKRACVQMPSSAQTHTALHA